MGQSLHWLQISTQYPRKYVIQYFFVIYSYDVYICIHLAHAEIWFEWYVCQPCGCYSRCISKKTKIKVSVIVCLFSWSYQSNISVDRCEGDTSSGRIEITFFIQYPHGCSIPSCKRSFLADVQDKFERLTEAITLIVIFNDGTRTTLTLNFCSLSQEESSKYITRNEYSYKYSGFETWEKQLASNTFWKWYLSIVLFEEFHILEIALSQPRYRLVSFFHTHRLENFAVYRIWKSNDYQILAHREHRRHKYRYFTLGQRYSIWKIYCCN